MCGTYHPYTDIDGARGLREMFLLANTQITAPKLHSTNSGSPRKKCEIEYAFLTIYVYSISSVPVFTRTSAMLRTHVFVVS